MTALKFIMVLLIGCFLNSPAQSASCYWTNGDGDSLWSNPANWKDNIKPGSNDVDRVYLGDDCDDEPQNIILDEPVWIYCMFCTATGNRDYTITPLSEETMRFSYVYGIQGSAARTVDLTINADLLIKSEYVRVDCYPDTITTLNGSIGPSPTERESNVYLFPSVSGELVLGASNDINEIRTSISQITFNHKFAPGPYIRSRATAKYLTGVDDVVFTESGLKQERLNSDVPTHLPDRTLL